MKSYDDILIHHAKHPVHAVERGFRAPWSTEEGDSSGYIEHRNRSCGDVVRLWWRAKKGVFVEVVHHASGCMLCKASASILCEVSVGMEVARVPGMVEAVEQLTRPSGAEDDLQASPRDQAEHSGIVSTPQAKMQASIPLPGPVHALAQVREFPTRRKCITLAWEALHASVLARE